jgi:CheY-like chemotaxis protein
MVRAKKRFWHFTSLSKAPILLFVTYLPFLLNQVHILNMIFSSVMIVDDNEADQYLTKAIVENFAPDAEIIQAYDGQQALELLGELDEAPDFIFLDINMPGMNGFEFLEKYQSLNDAKSPVLMLTSSDQEADQKKAKVYACVKAYLVKPLAGSHLKQLKDI